MRLQQRFVLIGMILGIASGVFAFPVMDTSGWERNEINLLDGFGNMYNPCVREVPDEVYPYRMWFFGWAAADCNPGFNGCDAIFVARSKDLKNWEVYSGGEQWDTTKNASLWKPVFEPDHKFYDHWHNGDPSVVLKDGKYYMAYSATSNNFEKPRKGNPNGMLLCIRGAVSEDGIHWARVEQPLLIAEEDMLDPETDANWLGDYHRPSLMWDEGKWKLWFDYWWQNEEGKGMGVCMGYAENKGDFGAPGGFELIKTGNDPALSHWPNPEVIKIGNGYLSFSDPPGYPNNPPGTDNWASRQICQASSKDGLNWKVDGYIPPDSDAPALHVPQVTILNVEGKDWLYLFYAVQKGGTPYDYRYRAIRAMRKPLDEVKKELSSLVK